MTCRLSPLIAVLTVMLCQSASALENVKFRRLSIEDGLSQSTVETIVQDHAGFMWIGTEDGLNRFDGYTFRQYRHDPDDPSSISDNNIYRLLVDREGYLWVGTWSGGLNRYDPRSESFTRYTHDPADPHSISSNRIRSIAQDSRGNLWIGTRDAGINCLEPGSFRFLRIRHDPDDEASLPSDNVRCVSAASADTLWIATNRGFSRYLLKSGEFAHHRAGSGDPGSPPSDNVRHILEDRSGMLWLSTNGGLAAFHPQSGLVTYYPHDPADPTGTGTVNIKSVFEDAQGRLWISTNRGGLVHLDRHENVFQSFFYDQSDPGSLSNNSPHVTFQDNSGVLWVGTFGGGICTYDPRRERFLPLRYDASDTNSLSAPIVWSITEGPDRKLWFGTNAKWLSAYDRSTDRFERIRHCRYDHRGNGFCRALLWDDRGLLWIGGRNNSVETYDPVTGDFRLLRHDETASGSAARNVRKIYESTAGGIWISIGGGGLDHLDRTTGITTNFTHLPDDPGSLSTNIVISLLQDSDGVYWVATSNGLNRLVFDDDSPEAISSGRSVPVITRFHHEPDDPQSLSNDYVVSIHESADGDLWFGTMLGLSRLHRGDREDPVFTRYFMKNGLPSDVVYGILEDDDGRLWLSTNFGISCFDPDTEVFRNYDSRDGLLVNEYNSGAYTRTAAGSFVFGGVNGANEFHPDDLVDSSYRAPIVLTGFNVFEEPAVLAESITGLEEITLSYRDNYFSIEFAALDYSSSDRNRYAYKLEGLDRDWTQAGTRHYAGYTHVDPGEYTFMVRGTNGDGVWNEDHASIRIIITPPFWRTWWFIGCLALAACGAVAFPIVFRVRQLLKIERLRSRIAADLHDDIGAGLTEISIMGEIITQKLPSESSELVLAETSRIKATARDLITSMSDIVWLVSPKRDSLYDLVSRLSGSARDTLEAADVRFRTQDLRSLQSTRLKMEHRQHLLLIFKEAINNSLKYGDCSEISLEVALQGKKLTVRLVDDGKGFDTSLESTGNGLHNMSERARRMGGALTIRSSAGDGTVVEYSGSIR